MTEVTPKDLVDMVANKEAVHLGTVGYNPKFPTQNQTKHCWAAFVEYQRCNQKATRTKNEELEEAVCSKFKRTYKSLCPNKWVDLWNQELQDGSFAGQEIWIKKKKHHHV